jgi:hypothetical protein
MLQFYLHVYNCDGIHVCNTKTNKIHVPHNLEEC